MITSQQTGAMFQNQMAQFAAMNAHSSNISAMSGTPMSPVSATPFSYGGVVDPYGTDSSSRIGMGAMAGAQSAGGSLYSTLGIMGGFGLLGGAGRMLDPFGTSLGALSWGAKRAAGISSQTGFFSAAGQAARAGHLGRFAMGGLAAGGAMMAPYLALERGASYATGQMIQGAQQDYAIHNTLRANATFYNPQAQSGRGFSTGQRDMISDSMRSMAAQDPFTDMAQLNRVMAQGMQSGNLRGSRDTQEFQTNFKKMVETLKETAKVLGTSLEEAGNFFTASKQMGFHSKADIVRNAKNVLTMAGGGLSAQGITREQAAGSAMARSMGMHGQSGAMLAQKSLVTARDMLYGGHMKEEDLREMTGGLTGEQGFQSLGRQMQQAAYNLSGSGIGRAVFAALGETKGEGKERRFTGKMDEGLMKQFRSGQLSSSDIRQMLKEKLSSASTDTKLSFLNMEKEMAGSFAEGAGAEGWGGVISMIEGQRGGKLSEEKVKKLLANMTGMGRRQIEYIMKAYKKQDEINQQQTERTVQLLTRKNAETEAKMYNTYEGITRQVGHRLDQTFGAPLREVGTNVGRSLRDTAQGVRDFFVGRASTAGMSATSADAFRASALGNDSALLPSELKDSLKPLDMRGGFLSRLLGTSQGDAILRDVGDFSPIARGGRQDLLLGQGAGAGPSALGLQGDTRGFDQGKMSKIYKTLQEAKEGTDSFFRGGAMKARLGRVRAQLEGLTTDQLFQLQETTGSSAQGIHRAKMTKLSSLLTTKEGYTGAFGGLRDQYARSKAAEMGENWSSLDEGKRSAYLKLAEEAVTGAATHGTDFAKLLGFESFKGGGAVGLAMFGEQMAQNRQATEKDIFAMTGESRDVKNVFADSSLRTKFLSLLGDDKETKKYLRTASKDDPLYKAIKSVRASEAQYKDEASLREMGSRAGLPDVGKDYKAALLNKARKLQGAEQLEGATVFARKMYDQGSELGGLRRADLVSALGEDMASKLVGTDEGKLGGLASHLKGIDPTKLTGDSLRRISGDQFDLVEKLMGMGSRELSKARGVLGKTQVGATALGVASRLKSSKKDIDELMSSDTSDEKFFDRLKAMNIDVGDPKGAYAKTLLEKKAAGDEREFKRALVQGMGGGAQKEDSVSLLATIRDSVKTLSNAAVAFLSTNKEASQKYEALTKIAKQPVTEKGTK